jgi:hypothetical protein
MVRKKLSIKQAKLIEAAFAKFLKSIAEIAGDDLKMRRVVLVAAEKTISKTIDELSNGTTHQI